jgi:CheY-like chemotaxis protein
MKTILLCEDDVDMVRLIESVVARAGYQLILAPDGRQAVDTALKAPVPDLVLMDLRMPKMDGLAATRVLRDKGFRNPIVILTASESADDRRRAQAAGCSGFILKTLAMADVEDTLDRLLGGAGDDGAGYELKT